MLPGGLGGARGSITIDTSQLEAARAAVRAFAAGVDTSLSGITPSVQRTERSFAGLSAATRELAGAFGISLGLAGAVQFGRFALEADRVATAYRRQSVAALHLAGSQAQLNELLEAYERATGGAVDRATTMADVTRLMAVGFADSAEELERIVRITRGISVAMGSSQDYILGQLQLALANQTTARFDQLGIGVEEFQARLAKLRAENRNLSAEMAFQQALLELAEEKYGDLADSAEAAATGAEQARAAFRDVRLEWGELTGGVVGFAGQALSNWLRQATEDARMLRTAIIDIGQAFGLLPRSWASSWNPPSAPMAAGLGSRTGIGAHIREPAAPMRRTFDETTEAALREWEEQRREIERSAQQARLDATRSYEEQRTTTIRQYEQMIAREAEDFARQRARAEQQFADQIADIRADAARREARQLAELTRRMGDLRADSAERMAGWEEDHAERLASLRAESNERIAELEAEYQRQRERAADDHRENLLGAAARLDAAAVAAEQRRYAQEQREAEENHRARVAEERESLDERIRQEQEAHEERLADEAAALAKRIRQAQEAHERQLQEAREADERRIAAMRADFEERKQIEDEDRAVRLARMAQDHNDQLDEMARQHTLRLGQIRDQAEEERTQLNTEFKKRLIDLGIFIDAWLEEQDRLTGEAIKNMERMLQYGRWAAAGLRGLGALEGGSHPSEADPYIDLPLPAPVSVSSRSASGNITLEPGAITVYGAPGQSPEEIARAVDERLMVRLQELAN